ncbi:MAG: glycosyltransferase family 2 protein [Bacteroidia bacterium]
MEINILILTYNRIDSLKRLVNSISNAHDLSEVNLYVSCDHGVSESILDYLSNLDWTHGSYRLIEQENHLGVKAHNLKAFELAAEMGNTLILEDDLYVAPYFTKYIRDVYPIIAEDTQVKAISLYRYSFMEEDHFPFELIPNSEFVYFQQRPCSKGCFYDSRMAKEMIDFFREFNGNYEDYFLPSKVRKWNGTSSWLKGAYCFLQEVDGYLAFPRYSLTTDFGDTGEHMKRSEHRIIHHSSLYLDKEFKVGSLRTSVNIYDSFYELIPSVIKTHVTDLQNYDFEVDLHGYKQSDSHLKEYMLTSKECDSSEMQWARALKPAISNVLLNQKGTFFSLAKTTSVKDMNKEQKKEEDFLYYFPDTKFMDLIKMKWKEIRSRK